MAFEDAMGRTMEWTTAAEAVAALGAQLALLESGTKAPPEIAAALQGVATAAGLPDLDQLPPPQRQVILSIIRAYLHQAVDLLEDPGRSPGWTYSDPAILDGWGRASTMVPPLIASAHPDLADVTSFLDVGTGVGLLAVAAANVWPGTTVVGIDPWDASLERARTNVAAAALGERITLRRQDLASIDDAEAFDCVWIPSFFLTEDDLAKGLPAAVNALCPGGWIALGRMRPAPTPVAQAMTTLRTIRGGGITFGDDEAIQRLTDAGCVDVHIAPTPGPAPLSLTLGQRPA